MLILNTISNLRMILPHKTIWKNDGCVVKIYGGITYQDVEKINSELCSNHNFDNINYFIRDLTAVKSVEISKDELTYAAYVNMGASSYKKKLKGAFVTNNKKIEANIKFYIEISKNIGVPWEQRIFESIDDASAWVSI